jgi:hypothetical protein
MHIHIRAHTNTGSTFEAHIEREEPNGYNTSCASSAETSPHTISVGPTPPEHRYPNIGSNITAEQRIDATQLHNGLATPEWSVQPHVAHRANTDLARNTGAKSVVGEEWARLECRVHEALHGSDKVGAVGHELQTGSSTGTGHDHVRADDDSGVQENASAKYRERESSLVGVSASPHHLGAQKDSPGHIHDCRHTKSADMTCDKPHICSHINTSATTPKKKLFSDNKTDSSAAADKARVSTQPVGDGSKDPDPDKRILDKLRLSMERLRRAMEAPDSTNTATGHIVAQKETDQSSHGFNCKSDQNASTCSNSTEPNGPDNESGSRDPGEDCKILERLRSSIDRLRISAKATVPRDSGTPGLQHHHHTGQTDSNTPTSNTQIVKKPASQSEENGADFPGEVASSTIVSPERLPHRAACSTPENMASAHSRVPLEAVESNGSDGSVLLQNRETEECAPSMAESARKDLTRARLPSRIPTLSPGRGHVTMINAISVLSMLEGHPSPVAAFVCSSVNSTASGSPQKCGDGPWLDGESCSDHAESRHSQLECAVSGDRTQEKHDGLDACLCGGAPAGGSMSEDRTHDLVDKGDGVEEGGYQRIRKADLLRSCYDEDDDDFDDSALSEGRVQSEESTQVPTFDHLPADRLVNCYEDVCFYAHHAQKAPADGHETQLSDQLPSDRLVKCYEDESLEVQQSLAQSADNDAAIMTGNVPGDRPVSCYEHERSFGVLNSLVQSTNDDGAIMPGNVGGKLPADRLTNYYRKDEGAKSRLSNKPKNVHSPTCAVGVEKAQEKSVHAACAMRRLADEDVCELDASPQKKPRVQQ